MKRVLLLIILIFSFYAFNSFAQTYGWYVIDPTSISGTPDFSDVFFTDANTGWITTTSSSNVFKTADGAATFSTQTTPLGYTKSIQMLDASNGYTGGAGGWVYNSYDGGLNWNILASMGNLLDMSFPPGTLPSNPVGYACGGSGQVWEITSGLTNLNSGLVLTFRGISAPSVNNVWVCGGNRIYYFNGTTFTSQIAPAGTFNDIHFINNQEGWVVGDGGVIGHTTNGGTSWVPQTSEDTQNRTLIKVFFLDTDNGWAVGATGVILHTINGGTTWTVEGAGLTSANLLGVHFTSTANGYVVGSGKTLIKFGELTAVENDAEIPAEFSLSQNYPNPFNPSTKIKITIPSNVILSQAKNLVMLKVYDVLGNEVATMVNEELSAGEYEVELQSLVNGHQLPTGVYFYQLKAGSFIQTKKMLLLK